jgi:phosphate transport system substrate-binding protein
VVIAFADERFDGLLLDAEVISAIFRREIVNYRDPRIAALNPGRELPDREIIPVHRSDGSGTTSVFTTWLSDEDDTWADELGSGVEVDWPAGTVGGPGNEGVAANVSQNPGGLGYLNQSYAQVLEMPQATVVNADGNPIYPTLESTTAGLAGLEIPDDFQFDILGVGGEGYPIAGTVWNFFWECGYGPETARQLKEFWGWAIERGDEAALALGYAPLDANLKQRVLAAMERIGAQDRPEATP